MEKIIKDSIEKSYREYQEGSIGIDENEYWAHEEGWKDGYEWILTELTINKEISEKTLKKYMNKIY